MSAEVNPIEYWTPDVPRAPQPAGQGQVVSMFTGPERVGWVTMLVVTVLASVLAIGIVATLGWALA